MVSFTLSVPFAICAELAMNTFVSDVRTGRGISDAWRRELTGAVRILDTGDGHEDALDPGNPRFRAAMAQALSASASESDVSPAPTAATGFDGAERQVGPAT